jgi:hypothetical protein
LDRHSTSDHLKHPLNRLMPFVTTIHTPDFEAKHTYTSPDRRAIYDPIESSRQIGMLFTVRTVPACRGGDRPHHRTEYVRHVQSKRTTNDVEFWVLSPFDIQHQPPPEFERLTNQAIRMSDKYANQRR